MGFSVQRKNFIRILPDVPSIGGISDGGPSFAPTETQRSQSFMASLIKDLSDNGFTPLWWEFNPMDSSGQLGTEQKSPLIVMDIPETVNSLSDNPYRIVIEAVKLPASSFRKTGPFDYYALNIHIGTPFSIPLDIPQNMSLNNAVQALAIRSIIQQRDRTVKSTIVTPTANGLTKIDRSSPWGYRLTITNRGFILLGWLQFDTETFNSTGFILVQWPILSDGSIALNDKQPLFVVNNTFIVPSLPISSNNLYRYVVREVDVLSTETPKFVTAVSSPIAGIELEKNRINYPDGFTFSTLYPVPTIWQTPATRDDNKYAVIFPRGLCSMRYGYDDQLDLFGLVKNETTQSEQSIELDLCGDQRQYTFYSADTEYRIGILTGSLLESF
ncbi:MAG: hypothetical protein WC284_16575 [Candidimonas sp.]